jgi:predicted secreted protein
LTAPPLWESRQLCAGRGDTARSGTQNPQDLPQANTFFRVFGKEFMHCGKAAIKARPGAAS